MTQLPAVPRHEQISAAWLSAALQSKGIEARVVDFTVEGVGTGQLGETKRFHLRYQGTPPAGAPRSVVGKFQSDNAVAATSGRDMGFYRSEVMFYRELRDRAVINTPKVYAAEYDATDGSFVLLLEDMAPATTGDHMQGCSVENARKALKEAAMLHAAFWNDAELEQQPWLYVPPGAQGFYTTELLESSWDYFVKNYAAQMDPAVIEVCEKFVGCHAAWNAPRAAPKCFSHNDFRVDNMLFGGERICIVDWQTSAYLGTGMDVAYFLGSAFDRATRKAVERDLLQEYLAALHARGVKDYDFDHLMADYRHYSFAVLVVAIAATVIVKKTERGDRLFMKMVTDGAYQAIDNDAVDALPV
ncbi:MAG: phosphotransferase [Proteobacteria bacterium]|nr:phosphotransferase [Pseudomonadota bacterium]